MADPADIAAETIETCLADAERRARGKSGPEHDSRFDGGHCVDCEIDIPLVRLNMGRVRCVDCQNYTERVRTLRMHNIQT